MVTEATCLLFTAVLGNESAVPPKNGSLYTEDDWNETSSIRNNEAYWLSKVHRLDAEFHVLLAFPMLKGLACMSCILVCVHQACC